MNLRTKHSRAHANRGGCNHKELDNMIPFPYSPVKPDESSTIRKSSRLGGLLKYCHRDNEKEEPKAA